MSRSSSGWTAAAYPGSPDGAAALSGDAFAGAGATTSNATAVVAIEAANEPGG
ncbi:hypothetical protein [Geodermatophilus obscurus]|uniref:hypothetical protein n=1 Tax=Geodermatophilus obscurus TaxID=1861 RepID=UPI00140FDC3E|nr:hypothetical protein [Geodermatophilus obscurus]